MLYQIKEKLVNSAPFKELIKKCYYLQPSNPLVIENLYGSLIAFVISELTNSFPEAFLIVVEDKDTAEKLYDDCQQFLDTTQVYLFGERPSSDVELLEISSPISQIETLCGLAKGYAKLIIASAYSISEKLPHIKNLKNKIIELQQGSEYSFQKLVNQLYEMNFERKTFVESCGDFSVRGGIVDVFPFIGQNPIRIDFWGDHIESVREFDPISQRSIKELKTATIVPDILKSDSNELNASLFDYLPEKTIVFLYNADLIENEINTLVHEGVLNIYDWNFVYSKISNYRIIQNFSVRDINHKKFQKIDFQSVPQPSFNKSIKLLLKKIEELFLQNYFTYIFCHSKEEASRVEALINETIKISISEGAEIFKNSYKIVLQSLHSGFIYHPEKVAIFTEQEILGRLLPRTITRRKHFKGISFKELSQFKKGDYVTHIDHGIGIFDGLQKIKIGNVEQEVVRIKYQDNDILYLNLNYVNNIQKYFSREGYNPRLSKLGSKDWERLKQRAKKKIKDIARDLIKLYAKRKSEKGFSFSADTYWQKELEASFMYEDTPDQNSATLDVKKDMESTSPMDRLICGDVGFGKTEVAVRAAFKAVMDNKQVAVLVPTTILAQQHYNTFRDRLERYSVKVESLSRFKSKKEQKRILDDLAIGKIDILIGTHRILSKDVVFKDLGLLIIDEEHRFGVSAKEKLRMLKANIDTLTLTATPIPRTLQFSLMGARDLSLINTPPKNRLPIITEIVPSMNGKKFRPEIIRESILRELHRGGQVYFVHDKIQNIEEIAEMLQQIVPEAKVKIAHGQMQSSKLEKIMVDFLEKKFDVLVSTKIIESGLDIPNVNTIIINRADRFGMAELYQLRGRVGRSNVQAYAYLLTPALNILPKPALKRLRAIEEFTELGSGFNLAMRDLEIRGAGNLLGAEQSGFILEMGFETYEEILQQAILELKSEEFNDLFELDKMIKAKVKTQIEVDLDAYIPNFYIIDDSERLEIYRRLYRLEDVSEIDNIKSEFLDRFGKYPGEVENLFKIVELKILASNLNIERIKIEGNNFILYFPDKENKEFYGTVEQPGELLLKVITFIKNNIALNPELKNNEKQLILSLKIPDSPQNYMKLLVLRNILNQFR